MSKPPLKPWPRDATMIICATPDEFRADMIRGVKAKAKCSDCGCDVCADTFTLTRAQEMFPNRPLKLSCIKCAVTYDAGDVNYFEDHRGGELKIRDRLTL